jgi:hypothetical protein
MISNKAILFGVILSFALILFLAFPTRLPYNLDPTLAQTEKNWTNNAHIKREVPVQKVLCDPGLYVSQNLGKGQFLQVSDGFYYKVAPEDVRLAAYWIGPAPITFCLSDDDEYPIQITNTYSGTSVRVKESSYDEINEKMKQLESQAPPEQQPMLPQRSPQPVLAPTGPQASQPSMGPTGPVGPTGPTGSTGMKKPLKPTRPTSPPTRNSP